MINAWSPPQHAKSFGLSEGMDGNSLQVREIESEEELDTLLASDERLTILLAGGLTARALHRSMASLHLHLPALPVSGPYHKGVGFSVMPITSGQ